MRRPELAVKAPEKARFRREQRVQEYPRKLLLKRVLLYAVVVIQSRLRSPADMERGMHMRFCPLHYLTYFLPVVHVLELHLFHRRAGDDEAVEIHVFYIVKCLVEVQQMLAGGVVARVSGSLHQGDFYLQRGIGKASQYLRFGDYLCRHEVENAYLKRSDILVERAVLRHDEYMLVFKY